jgi:hypothetical protein
MTSAEIGEHKLAEEHSGAFLGTNPSGQPVLLVPTTGERAPLDRATGNVAISFRDDVRFELRKQRFDAPAAILTCLSKGLTQTFRSLALDIATQAAANTTRPSPVHVSRLFASWEELLRRRKLLSPEEELGLWGELWFVLKAPNTDAAIACWRGISREIIDFVGGGVGIECKTTIRKLEHHFSQEQLLQPLGDLPVYFLSIWADRDEIGGESLNDMVAQVLTSCGEPTLVERRLLEAGYSREDAPHYVQKFRLLESPLWFEQKAIPRVRSVDAGVSAIRFLATLDETKALSTTKGIALLAQLCGA